MILDGENRCADCAEGIHKAKPVTTIALHLQHLEIRVGANIASRLLKVSCSLQSLFGLCVTIVTLENSNYSLNFLSTIRIFSKKDPELWASGENPAFSRIHRHMSHFIAYNSRFHPRKTKERRIYLISSLAVDQYRVWILIPRERFHSALTTAWYPWSAELMHPVADDDPMAGQVEVVQLAVHFAFRRPTYN